MHVEILKKSTITEREREERESSLMLVCNIKIIRFDC